MCQGIPNKDSEVARVRSNVKGKIDVEEKKNRMGIVFNCGRFVTKKKGRDNLVYNAGGWSFKR